MRRPLVVATGNPGKLVEIDRILCGRFSPLSSLADLGLESPEETGLTYAANARLKARACLLATGLPSLGDDSGLEVDALDGAPGLGSARFAPTAGERIAKLLRALEGVPLARRGARFVCVVTFAHPQRGVRSFRGEVKGRILTHPEGVGGFGYDPIFWVTELRTSMALLDDQAKDLVSHRGRALRKFVTWLDSASHS